MNAMESTLAEPERFGRDAVNPVDAEVRENAERLFEMDGLLSLEIPPEKEIEPAFMVSG